MMAQTCDAAIVGNIEILDLYLELGWDLTAEAVSTQY
jgi:hypothetical protein